MQIPFDLYRVFYFVAGEGTISAAAKKLFITQSAVSQSVKQLEDKLGGKLFIRTPRGILLTAEGEVVYRYVEQAYNFIITAESKFAEMQNLVRGEIRIGASDTLCRHYLAPHLEVFHREYPEVRIHVTNRTTPETIALLKAGKIDLGVINLPVAGNGRLVISEVLDVQDCFIAGKKYKHLSEKVVPLEELAGYPLLLLEKGSSTRAFIDRYAEQMGVGIRPEIELGSIDLLVQFARIGLGIAGVVKDFIHEELAGGEINEITLREKIPSRKIGIVTLQDVPLSAAGKRFMELLRQDGYN